MSAQNDGNGNGQGLLFELPPLTMADRIATASSRRSRPMVGGLGNVASSVESLIATVAALVQRVAAVECILGELRDRVAAQPVVKEFYSTQEVAKLMGKRPYTVREWCRLGRVLAEKTHAGRGLDEEWRISHEELVRIQNEGLLPLEKFSRVAPPRRLPR